MKSCFPQLRRFSIKLLFFTFFLCNSENAHAVETQEKMCWAHFVGWGFDQVNGYDKAALDAYWNTKKFNDRSLLGRHVQTDQGAYEGTKKQVRTALNYGIDGFCVDLIIHESHKTDFYANAMKRFYRAAEGTPFKIALCIDQSNPPVGPMTDALELFLKKWGRHPNSCLVNGKPVIFIYNSRPRTLDEWKSIIATLKERNLEAYWLVQPQRESTLWGKADVLADNLAVFDGLYDFGINGFTPQEMLRRLTNGQNAIKTRKPGAILSAGITQGYLGNENSFYRPYHNTGTLRQNWAAAMKAEAPWVCLTTWNDYVEHTNFEPSVANRDALLRINRDYVRQWRKQSAPSRPPQVFISYHEEARLGDDWTIEVLSLPFSTGPAEVQLRMLDLKGKPFYEPAPIKLKSQETQAETARLNQPGIDSPKCFRVQARILSEMTDSDEWRELYPVVIRNGHIESLRTIHIPLDELSFTPLLKIEGAQDKRIAKIRFKRWTLAGKVELLRNGWPVAEQEVAHKGAPHVTVSLPVPQDSATPSDVFIARYNNLSGDVSWSAPVIIQEQDLEKSTNNQPIIISGSNFDEAWRKDGFSRLEESLIITQQLAQAETYSLTFPMDKAMPGNLVSTSGWNIPALQGAQHKWMKTHESQVPKWSDEENEKAALVFDGADDCVILPSRVMPYGTFTMELNIRPLQNKQEMSLFSDFNGTSLQLKGSGELQFKRGKDAVTSRHKISQDKWTHIAVVYTGNALKIYINGVLDCESSAKIDVKRINSLPVIGNNHSFNKGFKGAIGGFHLQSGVLQPESFVLEHR